MKTAKSGRFGTSVQFDPELMKELRLLAQASPFRTMGALVEYLVKAGLEHDEFIKQYRT